VARIRYEPAPDVEEDARYIVERLGMEWIDLSRVGFVRSRGSRSGAVARIWGLPRAFQEAFGLEPLYVVEVISERYDRLTRRERLRVLIHELLHIPRSFSGGLRSHGRLVNERVVEEMYRRLLVDEADRHVEGGGGHHVREG